MNFARIIRLFIRPQDYWNEVVAEPGDIKSQLVPQMLILAAIPAASVFLGTLLGIMHFSFVRALIAAVTAAILTYIFQIAIWILFGVMINVFTGVFRGQKDFEQSMKLATVCCWDVHERAVIGNVTGQSVQEIWESYAANCIRATLDDGRRDLITLCSRCNAYEDYDFDRFKSSGT